MISKPLRKYSYVYVNGLFLKSAIFNENDTLKIGNLVCIKIGKSDREDILDRIEEHKNEYNAISIPLLIFKTNNSFQLEERLKKLLKKYKLNIRPYNVNSKIPNEFYTVKNRIIKKIKEYATTYENKNNMKLTYKNEKSEEYTDICEYFWKNYEKYNLETNLTILTSKSDSLTSYQKKIFKEYSFDDACEILGAPTKPVVTE